MKADGQILRAWVWQESGLSTCANSVILRIGFFCIFLLFRGRGCRRVLKVNDLLVLSENQYLQLKGDTLASARRPRRPFAALAQCRSTHLVWRRYAKNDLKLRVCHYCPLCLNRWIHSIHLVEEDEPGRSDAQRCLETCVGKENARLVAGLCFWSNALDIFQERSSRLQSRHNFSHDSRGPRKFAIPAWYASKQSERAWFVWILFVLNHERLAREVEWTNRIEL